MEKNKWDQYTNYMTLGWILSRFSDTNLWCPRHQGNLLQ